MHRCSLVNFTKFLRTTFLQNTSGWLLPTLDMILGEYKQLPDVPVMSKRTLRKWCKKLEFYYKWYNKKMQLYQRFDVDIVPPARTVVKMRLRHRCVLVNFKKFFILKLMKTRFCLRCFLVSFLQISNVISSTYLVNISNKSQDNDHTATIFAIWNYFA